MPVCLKYWRANFSAASTDSEPPLNDLMYFRSPGVTLASFSFSRRVVSEMPCSGAPKVISSICRRIASSTAGGRWPSTATKMPPMASKYRLPWMSQQYNPSARE